MRDQPPATTGIRLLASKLAVPPTPPGMVDRPRLRDMLDGGAGNSVVLLSASAGSGKSALLSSWARNARPSPSVAWLTLEPGDDGDRFWAYLDASLRSSGVLASNRGGVAAPGQDPYEVHLAQLVDAITMLPRPAVLILDDFHEVRDAEVMHALEFLVRHARGRLRLILSTRADPALPLHRWRVSGELAELRTRDLAFSETETAQLLARDGHELAAAQVAALHARTEGWPAGLRLAALSLRDCPDHDQVIEGFRGDQGDVADYLFREVFCVQPPDVREVLLSTAILERICGGLVNALTGRTDGQLSSLSSCAGTPS